MDFSLKTQWKKFDFFSQFSRFSLSLLSSLDSSLDSIKIVSALVFISSGCSNLDKCLLINQAFFFFFNNFTDKSIDKIQVIKSLWREFLLLSPKKIKGGGNCGIIYLRCLFTVQTVRKNLGKFLNLFLPRFPMWKMRMIIAPQTVPDIPETSNVCTTERLTFSGTWIFV